jgi:hypothetical protein
MQDLDNTPAKFDTSSGYHIYTTRPDALKRHDISDEELDMLSDDQGRKASDVMIGAIGAAIGSVSGAVSYVNAYFKNIITQLSVGDFIQTIIFACALACVVVILFITNGAALKRKTLKDEIRNRATV